MRDVVTIGGLAVAAAFLTWAKHMLTSSTADRRLFDDQRLLRDVLAGDECNDWPNRVG